MLVKGGDLDLDMQKGRTLYEDEGRDQGDASIGQRTPKIASKPSEIRCEVWDRFSLPALSKTNPADTFVSVIQPPELRHNTFLLFEAPSVWYFILAALGN